MLVMPAAAARRGWWSQFGLRLFLLAVLTAFVAVQDPAASTHVHSHCGAHTHCCAACHSGLFLAVPATAVMLPFDAASAWFTRHSAEPRPGNTTVLTSSSRAPPAAS
jgi:hypothetical protein